MKKNFIQEEFNELRNFQEKGLFSNAKAASEMIKEIEDAKALLDAKFAALKSLDTKKTE